jgi:hypothetical protein
MITIGQAQPNVNRLMWAAVALAAIVAMTYVMIEAGFLGVGDLLPAGEPAPIVYVAAGSYLVGGLLVLARLRWLWIAGAVMNALVMLFFFLMYLERPSVLLSPGGIMTKAAQLLLEVSLIYLIFFGSPRLRDRR